MLYNFVWGHGDVYVTEARVERNKGPPGMGVAYIASLDSLSIIILPDYSH